MADATLRVELDRTLPASPQLVYRALTEPQLYGQWMGPPGSQTEVVEMDVRIGGRLAFRVRLPDQNLEFQISGYYEDIEPGRRLVHSWMIEGDDSVSTVVFTLEPVGESTRLQITHHGLTAPEDVAQNAGGWAMQLDRLEGLLLSGA